MSLLNYFITFLQPYSTTNPQPLFFRAIQREPQKQSWDKKFSSGLRRNRLFPRLLLQLLQTLVFIFSPFFSQRTEFATTHPRLVVSRVRCPCRPQCWWPGRRTRRRPISLHPWWRGSPLLTRRSCRSRPWSRHWRRRCFRRSWATAASVSGFPSAGCTLIPQCRPWLPSCRSASGGSRHGELEIKTEKNTLSLRKTSHRLHIHKYTFPSRGLWNWLCYRFGSLQRSLLLNALNAIYGLSCWPIEMDSNKLRISPLP